jgi:hypothetical protein
MPSSELTEKDQLALKKFKDPIVEEVRKVHEELFKQANYDLHTLFENLRKSR